jgi:hypothetical protein
MKQNRLKGGWQGGFPNCRRVGVYFRQSVRFKVRRDIVFFDDLPRNVLGKVQHFRLKERWSERPVSATTSPSASDPMRAG